MSYRHKQCNQFLDKQGIDSMKDQLKIPEIWRILGLPGKPSKCCHSPFRDDKHPSFSVFDEGRRWKDHGTNEGGGAIEFLGKAVNLDHKEAFREYILLARLKRFGVSL